MTAGSGGPANLDVIEARAAAHDMDDGTCPWCDTVPALVAEVKRLRGEAELHALRNDGCVPGAAHRMLTDELDAARAAVERVRALHRTCAEIEGCRDEDGWWCHACERSYPCATVRALDPGAEPGEQR